MTRELVNAYYDGLARRSGWQDLLSDWIAFTMPGGRRTDGKAAFVEGNNQFLRGVKDAKAKQMLVDGNTACVWMNYDLVSPSGKQTKLDVLEIWTANNGRLESLAIYFDTAAFGAFMKS
jgi:hypothetical protein